MGKKKDRVSHPADAERKKQRKKDIASNKKKREQVGGFSFLHQPANVLDWLLVLA
jgi:hypothetical protein